MTDQTSHPTELAQRWAERVRTGTFSPAVEALGEIRIMGRSGDAPFQFPRISSLAALGTLEPDEQYALSAVRAMVEQAPEQGRAVFAVNTPATGQRPTPVAVTTFDPTTTETLIVVARIVGG